MAGVDVPWLHAACLANRCKLCSWQTLGLFQTVWLSETFETKLFETGRAR
jgi:hypothetical protein